MWITRGGCRILEWEIQLIRSPSTQFKRPSLVSMLKSLYCRPKGGRRPHGPPPPHPLLHYLVWDLTFSVFPPWYTLRCQVTKFNIYHRVSGSRQLIILQEQSRWTSILSYIYVSPHMTCAAPVWSHGAASNPSSPQLTPVWCHPLTKLFTLLWWYLDPGMLWTCGMVRVGFAGT